MITDGLDEHLDLFRGELALLFEDQFPLFVEGVDIAAVVGNLPCGHQHFLVVPHIDVLDNASVSP